MADNVLITNASVTDLPSFDVTFFLTDSDGHVINHDSNAETVSFHAYHQNLLLGNGSYSSVQREQIFTPGQEGKKTLLNVVSTGTLELSHTMSEYTENLQNGQPIGTLGEKTQIGLYNGTNPAGGSENVYTSFLNANVAVEQANGLTIKLSENIGRLVASENGDVYAHVVVTTSERNDLRAKTQIDLTEMGEAQPLLASTEDVNGRRMINVVNSSSVVASKSFLVKSDSADTDFTYTSDGSQYDRPIVLTVLADIFRSATTTLVAPVVVLHRLTNIETVKKNIKQAVVDDPSLFKFDPSVDLSKHFMIFSRLRYNDVDGTSPTIELASMLETDASNSNQNHLTITSLDPARELTYSELNGANAHNVVVNIDGSDINLFNTMQSVPEAETGNSHVHVEELVYLTSLLENSLLDKTSSLTNVFWGISDSTASEFVKVPSDLINGLNMLTDNESGLIADQGWARLAPYRKCLSAVLMSSLSEDRAIFVSNFLNDGVSPNFMKEGEVYDGMTWVNVLKQFGLSLKNRNLPDVKFPIMINDDGSSDTVGFLRPTHDPDNSSPQFEPVSRSFLEAFFGSEYLNQLLGLCINADNNPDAVEEYRTAASTFVQYANTSSDYTTLLASNTYFSAQHAALVGGMNANNPEYDNVEQYGLLILNALYAVVNMTASEHSNHSYVFGTTEIMSSNYTAFKSHYETVNVTAELSVRRMPRNLLQQTTSLELKYVTFVDNGALRNAILDTVGNPIEMLLPVILELKADDAQVTERREFELITDYLVECLNEIDLEELTNRIVYKFNAEGKREIHSIQRGESGGANKYNNKYESEGVLDQKSMWVATELYNKLMGSDDGINGDFKTVGTLLGETSNGVLRLTGVRDDTTARGELGDWRYHSIYNGTFAENPPAFTGGFGMQVVRWINSGLVGQPEAQDVVSNVQGIVNSIRYNLYNTNDNDEIQPVVSYNGDRSSAVTNMISQIHTRLTGVLGSTDNMNAFQVVLDHIVANDLQRLLVNERQREDKVSDNGQLKDGTDNLYLLPLIPEDTLTLITTVNGGLTDANENAGSQDSLNQAIQYINKQLDNPSNLQPNPDSDKLTNTTLAITGHSIAYDENGAPKQGTQGVYFNNETLLAAPQDGPWEKSQGTHTEATYQRFNERSWSCMYNLSEPSDFTTYSDIRKAQYDEINPVDVVIMGSTDDEEEKPAGVKEFEFEVSGNTFYKLYIDDDDDAVLEVTGGNITVGDDISITLPQNADFQIEFIAKIGSQKPSGAYTLASASASADANQFGADLVRFQMAAAQAIATGSLTPSEVILEFSDVSLTGLDSVTVRGDLVAPQS